MLIHFDTHGQFTYFFTLLGKSSKRFRTDSPEFEYRCTAATIISLLKNALPKAFFLDDLPHTEVALAARLAELLEAKGVAVKTGVEVIGTKGRAPEGGFLP